MKALTLAAMALCAILTGCSVQPLYSGLSSSLAGYQKAAPYLASIYISQPADRVHQLVRNELSFLFYGGGGPPGDPEYHMDIQVTAIVDLGAEITIGATGDEPTSSIMNLTARYSLVNVHTGEPILVDHASTIAAFDRSGQEFASIRAERDAEDRAAKELAAQIGLRVAAKLIEHR